jgi:hypothetical protein
MKRLKLLVQQKDNEITLLLSLINKKRSQQAGKEGYANDVVLGGKPSREDEDLLRSVVKDRPIAFKK